MNKKAKSILVTILIFTILILSLVIVSVAQSFNPEDNQTIGYEFLNSSGDVVNYSEAETVHIWNNATISDYFFDVDSGIQLTNHYSDFWTRNIFCIGFYNASGWNKIKCADELSGFNKSIETDDETYVNATLWKWITLDIEGNEYPFRFGLRYHLGLNDEKLSITIQGKNGAVNIPFDLGFAWRIADVNIPNHTDKTQQYGDSIEINRERYALNETMNLSFTNLSYTYYSEHQAKNVTKPNTQIRLQAWTEYLRLNWNENLDYEVKVYGDGTQENFYTTLIINAGHFNPEQEKSTTITWIDAFGDYITFYHISGESASSRGITTDGTNIWVIDNGASAIYKYDMLGNNIGGGTIDTSGEMSLEYGIATNDTTLFAVDYTTDGIYLYDYNGDAVTNYALNISNTASTGITTDGTNIWVLDVTDDEVYKYTMTGTYVDSFDISGEVVQGYGITNNGSNIYVHDLNDEITMRIRTYLINGTYAINQDIDLSNEVSFVTGLATDNEYIYACDKTDDKIWIYELNDDTSSPNVTINLPTNTTYNTSTIIFNGTAIDETLMDSCWATIDAGVTNLTLLNTTHNDYYNATNTTVPDGGYEALFYCNDSTNNVNNTETQDFYVDTVAPVVVIDLPANTTYTSNSIVFNVTATDTVSMTDGGCLVTIDSGVTNLTMTNVTNVSIYNITNETVPDGDYNAQFYCNDSANNLNKSQGINFSVDTVPPDLNITIITPTASQIFTEDEPTAYFNISTDVNVSTCYWSPDTGITNYSMTNTTNSTHWTLKNTTMIDGNYTNSLFYCNKTSNGIWGTSDTVDFDVDSVNVTRCRNLTVENREYGLRNNLVSVGTCINALNNNVFFDGNYFNITTSSSGAGFRIIDYNNFKIYNVSVNSTGVGIYMYNSNNLVAKNTKLASTSSVVFASSTSLNNTFVNVSYLNGVENIISGSDLTRKWYFQTEVNNSAGYLENAQVDIYNLSGAKLVHSELTDANGSIGQEELTEYVNVGGTKTYANNYEINTSLATYATNSTFYNLTDEQNIFHYVTLDVSNTAPTMTLKIPADNSWVDSLTNDMTCNSTDAEGNLKNVSIYTYKGGVEESNNAKSITGSTNSTTWTSFGFTLQGAYEWNCYVCDDLHDCAWAGSNFTLNIDSIYPTISFVYPTNITYNSIQTRLNYTANDTNIDVCWYSNGTTNSSTQTCGTNWTGLNSGQGSSNWTVYVNDSANNVKSANVTFFVDSIYPQISIDTPINDTNSSNNLLSVNYTATDTNIGSCWYSNDSYTENITLTNCTTNITTITWTEGSHNVTIWVNDTANNVNSSSISFNIDTVNPTANLSKPTNNTNTTTTSQNMTVNATDTYGIKNATLSIYNSTGLYNQTTKEYGSGIVDVSIGIIHDFIDGVYEWIFKVFDWAGNSNQTGNFTLRVDSTPPVINIVYPVNETTYTDLNLSLNYTISDAVMGLDSCWYTNDSGVTNFTITCGQNTTQNLSDNTYTYMIYSNDTLNNENSDSVTFTISTTAPGITLNYPTNNKWLNNGTNVYFNYTATDSDGLSECQLWINHTGTWHKNYTWISPTNAIMNSTNVNITQGDEEYEWNIWCNDTLNNGQFYVSNFTFNLDETYPLIVYDSETSADYSNLSQSHIYVNVTVTEINFQNITYSLYNDSGTVNTTTLTSIKKEINWTGLADNNYTYEVNITDKANNINFTSVRYITLDTTNPEITITNPTNNSNLSSATFDLNYTYVEINNESCWYSNNSGETNSTPVVTGTNWTNLTGTEGNINRTIYCNDSANNVNSSIIFFRVDTTYPNMTYSHFSPAVVYTETTVTIYGNATDTNLDSVWIRINYTGTYQNHTITNRVGDSYYYVLHHSNIENFENISWYWYANDSSDNVNVSALGSFFVTNRNPYEVNITSPINNSFINTDWTWINFTSVDTDVDNINYSLYNSTDGTTYSLFNSTNSSTFLNFSGYDYSDGATHYLYITANDSKLQNVSVTNITFTIDITNPNLTLVYPNASPIAHCSMTGIELNYSVPDTNIDYCEFNVTFGGLLSTAHTTISDCSNTTFNVSYDDTVQQLNFIVFDKAGNSNSTTRLIYIDTDNAACVSPPAPPGDGGGGGEEPEEERTLCGDLICQVDGNDYGLLENYWNCPVDCPGFDLDTLIYGISSWCWDSEEEGTPCFWIEGFGFEEIEYVCGDNFCEGPENFVTCKEDCGGFNLDTLVKGCFDKDEETPCFFNTNLSFYFIFGIFGLMLTLSFVKIKSDGRKVKVGQYIRIKLKKRRRRRR